MTKQFSWRRGLLGGIVALILGVAIFVYSSHQATQHSCVAGTTTCNDTPQGSFFQPYADFWLSMFAPECVGGIGPDDCIGPNISIMIGTLFVLGFVIGGLVRFKRKQKNPNTTARS